MGHRMLSFYTRKLKGISWSEVRAFLRFMKSRLDHARLQQVAGNLTFTTLLALVPLLTIALAVFATFPVFGTLRNSLDAYFVQIMMPRQIANTILGYLTIFTDKAGHLSAIGAVGVLVSAVAMISMIERSFNQIWRIRKPRPVFKRFILYLAMTTLGPFILGVSLTLTSHLYIASGGTLRHPSFLYSAWYALLSIIWTAGAFTVMYVVIPNRTIHWREAVWGGLFAAIAFEIVKRIFTAFIIQFPTYRMIYGAMAAIPIFLLWIYLSWLITLAGAAFVASIHYLWHGRWKLVPTPGGIFLDAVEILRLLHQAKEAGIDEASLRAKTGFGLDEIENLLQRMLAAGWVERCKPDALERLKQQKIRADISYSWKLVVNPEELTLANVFRLFVFDAATDSTLAKQVGTAVEQGLNETLAEHFARA